MLAQLKDSYQDLYKVGGLTLSVLSSEEVVQQSVSRIDEDATYKENGDPVTHGINDDLLGTMDKDRLCKTCMGTQVDCPGHFGHIALAKPVYHGNLIDYVQKVLRCVCFNCSHLLADNQENKNELAAYSKIKNEKSRFSAVFKLSANIK
jgi:DNA-directed RNA polymerase II subunit RPB1